MNLGEYISLFRQAHEVRTSAPEVNQGNIGPLRELAGALREHTWTQLTALKVIPVIREAAVEAGFWGDAVELWWEEYFVGKHWLMAAGRYAWVPGAMQLHGQGWQIMQQTAAQAEELIQQHPGDEKVQQVARRNGRFAGEVAMIRGDYETAIAQFREAIALCGASSVWDDRIKAVEIKGFLAEALIRSGQTKEGVELAIQTFAEYESNPDAQILQKDNAYTWAVWRSGCVIKACRALMDKGERVDGGVKEGLSQMLTMVEAELRQLPAAEKRRGDITMRLGEIAEMKKYWL